MGAARYPVFLTDPLRVRRRWEPDGEMAVFHFPRDYRFWLFNQSAALIVHLCDGSRTAGEVSGELCRAYGRLPVRAWERRVFALLRTLGRHGLVADRETPGPRTAGPETFGPEPGRTKLVFCLPRATRSDGQGMMLRHGTRPAFPLQLYLVVTHACNLRCKHCYERRHTDAVPLGADRIRGLIDAFARGGGFYLTLTGGEAFVREDLPDLIAHAVARGLHVRVNTNATLLTPAVVERLTAFRGSLSLYVSLEGACAPTHDYNRGKGCFEKTVAALRLLVGAGLDVFVDYTLNARNARELARAYRMLNRIGINAMNVGGFNPLGFGAAHEKTLYLPAIPYRWHLWLFRLWVRAVRTAAPRRYSLPLITCLNKRCLAGTLYLAVDPGGGAAMCELMDRPFGNVFGTPIADLWNAAPLLELLDANGFEKPCGICFARYTCNGKCRAYVDERTGRGLAGNPDCLRGKLFGALDRIPVAAALVSWINAALDRYYARQVARHAPYKRGRAAGGAGGSLK